MHSEEEEEIRNRLDKRIGRLLSGPRNTPEEVAQIKEEREGLKGTARQWAEMQPDHTIARHIAQSLPNGMNASADSVSTPGDPDYEELCKLHNLQKPGDASTIFKRLAVIGTIGACLAAIDQRYLELSPYCPSGIDRRRQKYSFQLTSFAWPKSNSAHL